MFHGTQRSKNMIETEIRRDEHGRVVAADGYPTAGCAKMAESQAVSGLSKSKLYNMIGSGELETKTFGKSRRITWASLRKAFLSSEVAQ